MPRIRDFLTIEERNKLKAQHKLERDKRVCDRIKAILLADEGWILEFVVLIDKIVEQLPRGRAYLADQVLRAATSIPLNIAEGAGEYSNNEKCRFYRMEKRSATDCAGILDACRRLRLVQEEQYEKGRELLIRIVAMLTKMAQKID